MAKFAEKTEKPFSPISHKLIDAVSAPPPLPQEVEREGERVQTKVVEIRPQAEPSPREETSSEPTREAKPVSSAERLTRMMRYMVSDEEKKEIEEFLRRLSDAAGVTLTHSNVIRACRDVLLQTEEELLIELGRAQLKRPINDKRAIAFFESRLTAIIQKSVREQALSYQRRGGRGER